MAEKTSTPTAPIELPEPIPEKTVPATPDASTVPEDYVMPLSSEYFGVTDVGYLAIIPIK
jgi:hypothetical protein